MTAVYSFYINERQIFTVHLSKIMSHNSQIEDNIHNERTRETYNFSTLLFSEFISIQMYTHFLSHSYVINCIL